MEPNRGQDEIRKKIGLYKVFFQDICVCAHVHIFFSPAKANYLDGEGEVEYIRWGRDNCGDNSLELGYKGP